MRDGSLDYTLLQPVYSQFLVSFSRIVIWRVWDIALAIALIVVGMNLSGGDPTPGQTAAFLLLLVSGATMIYSLWIVLIACTFWFVKFDNNVTILQALMDSGRYPATVYPAWLRAIITFVVPIAAGHHRAAPGTAWRPRLAAGAAVPRHRRAELPCRRKDVERGHTKV